MRFNSSVLAVLVSSAVVSAQQVVTVQVGGNSSSPGGFTIFTPNQISAPKGSIVSFQFTGAPGNHTVTQSNFANPCDPVQGGFDSGWIARPEGLPKAPEWNLTITDDQTPIWFYCKQLIGPNAKPHCNLGMVGVINVGQKSFPDFQAAASTAAAVGQTEGGFVGIGASATGAPFIPSGAIYANPGQASATAPGGGSSASGGAPPTGTNPPNSGFINGAGSGLVLLATLFGMATVL
ncbi:hypothetical protein DFH08DRAFT_942533 [Mycena albidolilacea]|uniref:Extracellular serine-rich protein n=1 Tax=Mycena albidolilacea TaxID=1033008 RepID=A0AAD6ZE41_9AGAR|nr:hypothetical protein DFH08DRAFT_942533 [Mycena albidolilacea]